MNSRELTAEYRMTHWAQLLQERTTSGLSVQDFCLDKGITRNTYFYWQKKLREAACARLSETNSKTTDLTVQSFAEVRLSESSAQTASIQPDQLCVESGLYRVTAGPGYPIEYLTMLLREVLRPC